MKRENAFIGAAAVTTLAALWLLWPYMDAILWAGFTAYFLHHFSDWLNKYVKNRTITSALVTLLLIGFVAGLLYGVLTSIPSVLQLTRQFSDVLSASAALLIDLLDLSPELAASVENVISEFTVRGRAIIISMFSEIPLLIIHLLIYFVVAAFLVKDGKQFKTQMFGAIDNLPTPYRETTRSLIASIDRIFRGVFLTYFIVALVVGILATAGFYILGVDFYWGWGLIIGIFAFFPIVSSPMVYVPLSLLYIAALDEFWLGVIILTYGVIVLNTLPEVLLRPYLASQQTKEHPLLLFTGFIIGPFVMGFKGIILGPIILVVAKDMLTMKYYRDFQSTLAD